MAEQCSTGPEHLLSKFRELDVFPPGFVLQCPVCKRNMPPASAKGSAQLLQCTHHDPGRANEPTVQMAQDGQCYTINTRGVAFGGPDLADLQDRIQAWGRTPQGIGSLAKWKSTMTDDLESGYWATLAENKRLVEAGAAQQAAQLAAQQAGQQAFTGPTRVGALFCIAHVDDCCACCRGDHVPTLTLLFSLLCSVLCGVYGVF